MRALGSCKLEVIMRASPPVSHSMYLLCNPFLEIPRLLPSCVAIDSDSHSLLAYIKVKWLCRTRCRIPTPC